MMNSNGVPTGGRPSSSPVIVFFIVLLMTTPVLFITNAAGPDPAITKIANEYDAVWDFSDPVNYTFENTTLSGGQLKLANLTLKAMDASGVDFQTGTTQQVKISPKGSLVLVYKTGSGFTDVTTTAGVSASGGTGGRTVAWGDYNNDGLIDLLIGPNNGRNVLFKNNDGGTFTDLSTASGIRGAAGTTALTSIWGDYNNDGNLDLAQVTATSVLLWKNNGDGTFTSAAGTALIVVNGAPKGGTWLDYNHDGSLDLFVDGGANNQYLWNNNKDTTFSDVATAAGLKEATGTDGYVTAMDINNDSWSDLVKNQELTAVKVFKNDKDGTFTESSSTYNLTGFPPDEPGADLFDLNNDGQVDLYWAAKGQDSLWVNKGAKFWNLTTSAGMTENRIGRSSAIADYNLDGREDIFVPSNGNKQVIMWQNNPAGTFTDTASTWGLSGTYSAECAAWADYDNDGNPDIYMTQSNLNGGHLFKNNFASDNFIKVRLVGDKTNKAALGARLELYAQKTPGQFTLVGDREVKSSVSSGCSNSLEQIFGVDPSFQHKLVVRFPGGKTVNVTSVQAPAYLQVSETGTVTALSFNHHYINSGNFTSRGFNLGKYVALGNISWGANVPKNTSLAFKTRTSPDGTSWSAWSASYTQPGKITSPKDQFIQYTIQFSSTNPNDSPEVFNVTMTYSEYAMQGTAVTKTFDFGGTALKTMFSSFGATNGQSISYSYSKDVGKTWTHTPGNGNLSSEYFPNITLRAELSTTDDLVTPAVQYMKLHYALNSPPTVTLRSPINNAYAGTDQELKWNGTDPDKQTLTYDVFTGNNVPYPKVASNILGTSFTIKNLFPGRTYFWYVVAKDTCNATTKTQVWTFIANSPPNVNLQYPSDKSLMTTTKVRFEWIGVDNAGLPLTYDLYLEKDGLLSKGVSATNKTMVQLTLVNKKTYKWYVIGNDSLLTNRSETWTFSVDAPINHLPQVTNTPPTTAVVGKPYTFTLQISDADGDHVLPTFIPGHIPPGMILTTSGDLMWTPANAGVYSVGILLDDRKDQVPFYFNITVALAPPNQPPKIIRIPDQFLKSDPVTLQLGDYVTDDGGPAQLTLSITGGDPKLFTTVLDGTKLKITPLKYVKGKGNLTLVATDSQQSNTKLMFNVTVDNNVVKKQDLLTTLCQYWPVFLIVLILVIVAIVLTVRARRKAYRVERPVEKHEEKFETWDQMHGDLSGRETKVEEEEGASFRGVGGDHYDEEAYQHHAASPVYVPVRPNPPPVEEELYAPPQQPVFGETYADKPAPGPAQEQVAPGPVWKPATDTEKTKVFKDEKAEKAQQDAEIDDILNKLKVKEPDAPKEKKEKSKDPSLDDLLNKLKKK
jgi:hypothetical protein